MSRSNITFSSVDSEEESGSMIPSTSIDSEIWNFGKPTWRCRHCKALLWYDERLSHNRSSKMPSFGICCKNGKISLPEKKKHPAYLEKLFNGDDNNSKNFREHIISYNSMFSFTSTGRIVGKGINTCYGQYVFRMDGQSYHHIGTCTRRRK
jgi:hypothetical protein